MNLKEKIKIVSIRNMAKMSLFIMLFSLVILPVQVRADTETVDNNSTLNSNQISASPAQISFEVTDQSELSYNTNQSQIFNSSTLPVAQVKFSASCISSGNEGIGFSIQGSTSLSASLNVNCEKATIQNLSVIPVHVAAAQNLKVKTFTHHAALVQIIDAAENTPGQDQGVVAGNFVLAKNRIVFGNHIAALNIHSTKFEAISSLNLSILQIFRC